MKYTCNMSLLRYVQEARLMTTLFPGSFISPAPLPHMAYTGTFPLDRVWFFASLSQASWWSNTKNKVTSSFSEPWSLNQFRLLRARSSYENYTQNVPINKISCWLNLWMPVTSLWTHAQSKKLKFSEMVLSFVVKVKLSTFVCVFFCKIMAGTMHVSCIWPLSSPKQDI